MTIYSYSTTAGLNSTVGGVNVAEGTSGANLNNAIRAMMADLKGWANDIGGAASTTGSSNTYALTTSQTVAGLADGIALMFIANHTNTGAATLNVDTLGAKAMRGPGDVALIAGDIVSGAPYLVAYDASANSGAGAWLVLNPSTTGNAALAALAALTPSANKMAYYTSGTAAALADLSAFGRTLIDDADAATARATLGLILGTDVQAYDADLAAVAGLSSSGVIARTGAGTAAARTITGTANQIAVTNGDGVSGNPTLALAGHPADLAGLTLAAGDILYVNGSGDLVNLARGTDGQALVLASGLPSWGTGGTFTSKYESAEQTISAAGGLTLTHGLGGKPFGVSLHIVCKSAEHGYSIGDEAFLASSSTGALGVTAYVDNTTEIGVRFDDNASPLTIQHKTTGANVSPTNASWRLVVRAWR